MIILLSGEGVSDLGQCRHAQTICSSENFQIGPMTLLVDQIIQQHWHYSLRTIPNAFYYISESALKEHEYCRKNEKRKISLVGKKRDQETGYFYINAWMLGDLAIAKEKLVNDSVIAVLFRDCDGTRSSKIGLWHSKWESMLNGFKRAGFNRGVPMLPKPKSEAWLICAAKKTAYQQCRALEDLSGNDDSPNSLKKQLAKIFGEYPSATDLCEWLEKHPFDIEQASNMPSFKAFKQQLEAVLKEIVC